MRYISVTAVIMSFLYTLLAEASISQPNSNVTLNSSTNNLMQDSSTSENLSVKSFQQWKTEKILESLNKVTKLKTQIEQRKRNIQSTNLDSNTIKNSTNKTNSNSMESAGQAQKSFDKNTEAGFNVLESQLSQELDILEMNKQMTVADYFFMYLASLPKSKDVFTKAANQLSAEEMAEIILLYAQHVSNNSAEPLSGDVNLKDAKSQK